MNKIRLRYITLCILMMAIVSPARGLSSVSSNIVSCQVPGGGIVGPIQLEDEITTFDYCGRSAFEDAFRTEWGKNLIYKNGTLTTLLFDGGYVSLDFIRPFLAMPKLKPASLWSFGLTKTFVKSGTGTNATYTPTYHFYMRDHLGSNRVVASAAGVAEQVNHYYPYDSTFYGETSTDHRFKYCGRSALRDAFETTWRKKELDRMHGLDWYDTSARYYDHVLGRFHQIDPLAEKYYAWGPYTYCMGNPVNAIAPDGRGGLKVLLKGAYKIGKSVAKNGLSSLGKGATYATAFNDVVDDAKTVFDSNASSGDRVVAGFSLLSEVMSPVSYKDAKTIDNAANGISRRILPNGGNAKYL